MADTLERAGADTDAQRQLNEVELKEWLESLEYVLDSAGPERTLELLERLEQHAKKLGVEIPFSANTPYINTIPAGEDEPYPGDLALERRIRNLIRWNAVAMVLYANKHSDGIGGHLSTYASAATLYEVGMNHFFRGPDAGVDADQVYFQGHASPGMYARSYLERRLDKEHLRNFRRELQDGPGLSSYPHAWLMPEYWTFATVSMVSAP